MYSVSMYNRLRDRFNVNIFELINDHDASLYFYLSHEGVFNF